MRFIQLHTTDGNRVCLPLNRVDKIEEVKDGTHVQIFTKREVFEQEMTLDEFEEGLQNYILQFEYKLEMARLKARVEGNKSILNQVLGGSTEPNLDFFDK